MGRVLATARTDDPMVRRWLDAMAATPERASGGSAVHPRRQRVMRLDLRDVTLAELLALDRPRTAAQRAADQRWWRAQPPSAAEVRERALEAAACGWPDQAG